MRIGITPRFEQSKFGNAWYSFEVELLSFLKRYYLGAELELLSPESQYISKNLDLVVLGGGDTPGENLIRDRWESNLINFAISREKRLIGICRGAQLISNYFGGTLRRIEGHVNVKRSLRGVTQSMGTCFHSFAISDLAPNLEVLAEDRNDNSPEIYWEKNLGILGIMSHPERYKNSDLDYSILTKHIGWS